MKKFKLITLATVAALSSAVSPVQADVIASAIIDITNFKLTNAETGDALNNINDITILAGNNFGTLSATLASVPGTAVEDQDVNILSPAGGQFDGTQQCQGSGCFPMANNDFSSLTIPPTSSFAYADNNLQGASISLDLNNDEVIDIPAGVTAQTRADVSLVSADEGTSTSTTGTNASLEFISNTNITMRLSFDVFAQALAYVSLDSLAPSNATAGIAWNFVLTNDTTGEVFEFTPSQLNTTRGRNDSNNQSVQLAEHTFSGPLSEDFNLIATNSYSLVISHQVQANAKNTVSTVPEPGVLALLGFGMLAMAVPARVRRKS